jgi:signal transduction histidine kinase/DNA-binding NarL/FixJ family response regulator
VSASAIAPEPQHQDSAGAATAPTAATPATAAAHVAARAAGLIAVAEDLAGEFSLRPLLERILRRCTELLDCHAGSICSVDEAAGTYRKEADIGIACQSGAVFPLTEGMTGVVVARRAPVWFARYDQVPGGHVAAHERATLRGVIGVPLEWRGRIIGACIVFSRDASRQFGQADADLLQLFARHAAIALANARMHEAAEDRARAEAAAAERDRLLAELNDTLAQRLVNVQVHLDSVQRELAANAVSQPPGEPEGSDSWVCAVSDHLDQAAAATRDAMVEARQTLVGLSEPPGGLSLEAALKSEAAWAEAIGRLEVRLVTAGTPGPVDLRLARELTWVAREALTNIVRHADAHSVRIGLLYEPGSVSLLVQDDGQGFDPGSGWQGHQFGLRTMTERARDHGANVDIDSLPGWGTRIRARFPYLPNEPERGGHGLRVLIAARRPVLRAGLSRLLTWTEPGAEVIGEVETADQALEACHALHPDVALVDLGLPVAGGERDGSPGTRAGSGIAGYLLVAVPGLAVVGLCEAGDDELVADAVRAGARGCVDVGASGPELAQAVVAAGRGQAILSDVVLDLLHRGMRADDLPEQLTDREREVCGLMEQGLPDRAIAQRLVLSVKTVEKHAGAVLRKTGARNRTELAALAGRSRPR